MFIRAATEDDCQTLADFNCALASETEDHELDAAVVLNGVRRGLERSPEVQYHVAEVDAEVIGQLMVTREWSDWRDGWLWWIQSVYVQAEHRGNGVFRSLLKHVTDLAAADSDVVGIRLYVENANDRAREVYAHSGFVDPNYRVLEQIFDA